jgi:hypothetical protein
MNKISVEQFAILSDNIPTNDPDVRFGASIDFKADTTNRLIACETKFIFEDCDKPFMKLDIQCTFDIEKCDWNKLANKDKQIVIPQLFLCHIAMHTIGTARGILHQKTESTPFNIFIIPPIDIEEIIKNNFTIQNQ